MKFIKLSVSILLSVFLSILSIVSSQDESPWTDAFKDMCSKSKDVEFMKQMDAIEENWIKCVKPKYDKIEATDKECWEKVFGTPHMTAGSARFEKICSFGDGMKTKFESFHKCLVNKVGTKDAIDPCYPKLDKDGKAVKD